ncbi:hypothetical protein [Anaerofustis sp.]|uniref:hypothetical protein n=1 Tax=Anaerofustis sp. TaxID=1872517 RepID=UPI0025B95C83|nr:hypothetical protein [Anaerofustis sp.]
MDINNLFDNREDIKLESFDDFYKIMEENRSYINEDYEGTLRVIKDIFDEMYFLALQYMKFRSFMGLGNNKNLDMILSTVIKSMNNLLSVIKMTTEGNIGSSRIIMRNIFEFLVIGKYALLYDDIQIRDKWDKIEYINIDRIIFNNTIYPNNKNKKAFLDFWATLCKFTHATRASGQISYDYKDITGDVKLNFTLILMFLYLIYSYLNKYLATPYIKEYIKNLSSMRGNESNVNLKKSILFESHLKKVMKDIIFQPFSPDAKMVCRYFVSNWRVNEDKLHKRNTEYFNSQRFDLEDKLDNNKLSELNNNGDLASCDSRELKSKEDIINYLIELKELYSKEKINSIDDTFKNIFLKYIKRLLKVVKMYNIKTLSSDNCVYELEVTNSSLSIVLYRKLYISRDTYVKELEVIKLSCDYIEIDDYAKLYNITSNTVKRWIREVKIRNVKKIAGVWFIPEMQQKPSRNYDFVFYEISNLSKECINTFSFLKCQKEMYLKKINKDSYKCVLLNKNGKSKTITISNKDRIVLEKMLLRRGNKFEEINIYYL